MYILILYLQKLLLKFSKFEEVKKFISLFIYFLFFIFANSFKIHYIFKVKRKKFVYIEVDSVFVFKNRKQKVYSNNNLISY